MVSLQPIKSKRLEVRVSKTQTTSYAHFLLLILLSTGYVSCDKLRIEPIEKKGILFIGHPYLWHLASDRVDERIERINLKKYKQLWLGGDLCSETTEKYATLGYLDGLFDLSSSNTHWTLGNHDVRNGNWDWISEFTSRDLHYVQDAQGMTIIVTNSNYSPDIHCDQLDEQYQMIRAVCDTISTSSHLIMLSHLVTWGGVEDSMKTDRVSNLNWPTWKYSCIEPQPYFHRIIYPMLKEVQERGIQVVVISGDAGQKDKQYQYQTADGLWFLASGINNSFEKDEEKRKLLPADRLLYLEYSKESRSLVWTFPSLDSLLMVDN